MLSTWRYFFKYKINQKSRAGECKGGSNKQEDLSQVDQRLKFAKWADFQRSYDMYRLNTEKKNHFWPKPEQFGCLPTLCQATRIKLGKKILLTSLKKCKPHRQLTKYVKKSPTKSQIKSLIFES